MQIKKKVKKAVKRAVARRAVRPRAKTIAATQTITEAEGDARFWLYDGGILANLNDLAAAFVTMTDDQFRHHADEEKNDFAAWTEHILCDAECARKLRAATTPRAARRVVLAALASYH